MTNTTLTFNPIFVAEGLLDLKVKVEETPCSVASDVVRFFVGQDSTCNGTRFTYTCNDIAGNKSDVVASYTISVLDPETKVVVETTTLELSVGCNGFDKDMTLEDLVEAIARNNSWRVGFDARALLAKAGK